MGKERLIKEMKGHVVNKIVPGLNPSVSGRFQVRLIGIHHDHAEIELRIVDENNCSIKSFGSKVIKQGGKITLEGLESKINFLPGNVL